MVMIMPVNERVLKTTNLYRQAATPDIHRKTAGWNRWSCADSVYRHHYDREVSFIVQAGAAIIELNTGERLEVIAGDFVTIQPGVTGEWQISQPLENRFCYHDSFDTAASRPSLALAQGTMS